MASQLTTPDPPAAVTLDGDSLLVRALSTDDPGVVAAARKQRGRPGGLSTGWVVGLLALGARAVGLASGVLDDAAMALRLDAHARAIDRSAETQIARVEQVVLAATDAERGAVPAVVRSSLERLGADLRALVANEDTGLRRAVDEALARTTGGAVAEISRHLAAHTAAVRAAVSPDEPGAPMAVLRRELRESGERTRAELAGQLTELRAAVEGLRAQRAVLPKASAQQGASYEEAVSAAVVEAAGALGDAVEPTGTAFGSLAGSKVGDVVCAVADRSTGGLPVRVVVEAKAAALSSARWRKEADEARGNRAAGACLGVVDGVERMPGGSRSVWVLDPLNVLVAWSPGQPLDLLAAAYTLLRAAAVAEALRATGREGRDVAALEGALREAYAALEDFEAVVRAEAATRRGLDELRRALAALRARLEETLARGLGHGGRADGRLGA